MAGEEGKHVHRKGTILQVTVSGLVNTKELRRVEMTNFLFVLSLQSYWDKISVQKTTFAV